MRPIDADLIRDTIIPMVGLWKDGEFFISYKHVLDIIDNATTIEIPQWTLCSEKSPSEDGWYLIALEFEWGIEYEAGKWEDGMWWNNNSHVNIAWMPKPELYTESKL